MDKDLSFKTNDVGQCLIGCLINEDINDYTNGTILRQLSRASCYRWFTKLSKFLPIFVKVF